MSDREFIAVFHYDNGGTNRCGAEPYRYAEEIVRCKACKYYENEWCYWRDEYTEPEYFCSYGEVVAMVRCVMSKYIDYDAIDYRNDKMHDKSEEFLNGVVYMAERIEEAPSIDIVRCKECKWYDLNAHECTGEVNSTDHEGGASYSLNFYDDDFCSYGERREP